MKKVLITTLFLFIGGFILGQNRAKDESAINAQIDAMIYSWNNHNYDDLKNYTTEDTDWVNVVGMWWKGRKESQYAHQAIHNMLVKNSVCEKKSVSIRFVTKDVAIAHLIWNFTDIPKACEPGTETIDSIATIVYVNQNGKWLMTAGENVAIQKQAQEGDPIRQMPKN